ncbi:DinG family ATP-dependent helicase conserved hypothetical protein [Fructilactobacillus florum 8D]|uniref:Helicase ATP-binding domain-containing protein n=4 Tax=Fructilactobacillus florum TaxID=640331 RepID=W9EF65_9LACO|nr:ATP-dependent DNA helicase [Fructilactobacillus florum]ETO40778.1 DinG family ATP-dependent helicase conserved hypothetical protein [Fructilactobacillus florum 8D]
MPSRIGVRELVSFILRSGDLNRQQTSMNTAQAGTRIHQRLQRKQGKAYHAEYALSTTIQLADQPLLVHGRADGVVFAAKHAQIDEIKTSDVEFSELTENQLQLYWGQVKIYAHLLFAENPELSSITMRLIYVQTPEETSKITTKTIDRQSAAAFFKQVTDEYAEWLALKTKLKQECITSANQVNFPFPKFRQGQRQLAAVVYKTIVNRRHLFVEAPTGTGKTISTIFPAIKALGTGQCERIFYLTAKQSTRRVAEQAIAALSQQGLRLHSLTITAKDQIRFPAEQGVADDANPYMLGYYDRLKPALKDLLLHQNQLTRPIIERYAQTYQLDPFEFSLDASLFCDVIIGDYNYLFDPIIHLQRFFAVENPLNCYLIDETHNLVDRAREMYSTELDDEPIQPLLNALPADQATRKVKTALRRVQRSFTNLNQSLVEQQVEFINQTNPDEDFNTAIEKLSARLHQWLRKREPSPLVEQVLAYYFVCLRYLKLVELFNDHFRWRVLRVDQKTCVRLLCLDPSPFIAETLQQGGGSILFSATLSPLPYYRQLLGAESNSLQYQLPSPFPPARQAVLITSYLKTTYQNRTKELPQLLASLKILISANPGHYLVFIPSNVYLDQIYQAFLSKYPEVKTVKQTADMSSDDRESFLQAFAPEQPPVLGFALLSGIFSEGIDLVGKQLIGVAIVGVGLPKINPETNLLQDYFTQKNGFGFAYAYQLPGFNHVLQAAGRLIRSSTDRGIVALFDQRFTQKRYTRLFPPHWSHYQVVCNQHQFKEKVKNFWNEDL